MRAAHHEAQTHNAAPSSLVEDVPGKSAQPLWDVITLGFKGKPQLWIMSKGNQQEDHHFGGVGSAEQGRTTRGACLKTKT